MPEIRPVSRDNWQKLVNLKVGESQNNFVAPNVYSIAQSQFGIDYQGHWDLQPFGIFDGNDPVGFLMFGFNFEHPKYQAFIIRLMVDERFQGRGFGRFGLERMLEIFRTESRVKAVGISYEPENEVARKLYASCGFVETGEMLGPEIMAVLDLS
ncbi:MAG: GNAT family N-acetyltransferase [Chloroflexota bacterium]